MQAPRFSQGIDQFLGKKRITLRLGLNKILGTIHAYPTWMEANKFAAGNWKKAHAPQWALDLLEKFHRWRR